LRNRLSILALFFAIASFSQEANIWYFGERAGLDFNGGSPVALTDGQLDTDEGCATLSDSSGQLLFYTDGITVYNKLHQVMPNGTGLMGHSSSAQSATIVQKPGSSTLFYIFTTDNEHDPNGFRYSIVDISLAGGLGSVTSDKNVMVFSPSLENIGITQHANNIDYWIVGHGWNSNNFYSYKLTASGLASSPVVTSIGATISGIGFLAAGNIKISPSGSKLAFTSVSDIAQLFDFDDNTGVLSNGITLSTETGELYGIEFSPNENVLYITNTFNRVYQYDLTASDIPGSKLVLYNGNKLPAALQLGPDGKIYLAVYNQFKLGVINNPNVVGAGCNFQLDAIDLGGKMSYGGLPSFNRSFFSASFTAANLCLGENTQFNLNSPQGITSATWDFGDSTPTSNSIAPLHQYTNPGDYTVTVIANGTNGTLTKAKIITITATPVLNSPVPDVNVCGPALMTYNLSQNDITLLGSQSASDYGVDYFLSAADANSHVNVLSPILNLSLGSTVIFAKIYTLLNRSCSILTDFKITLSLSPTASEPPDLMICDDIPNDDTAIFNLATKTAAILAGEDATSNTVSYHFSQNDADAGNAALPLNYQNTTNPQTIYARVQNNLNMLCFATTSFQIGLYDMPEAHHAADMYDCDLNDNGVGVFDLTQQSQDILGSQSTNDFNVSYHTTQIDADSGLNAISSNFSNSVNPQTVYVRVENKNHLQCYATTSFKVEVVSKPSLELDDSYPICEGYPITIAAPSGFTSYSWSDGSSGQTATFEAGGNYSLTVSKDYGYITCSNTKNFTVDISGVASITNIETSDWTSDQNTIIVHVSGLGDWEYSLDGEHFQNSNVFNHLDSGQYTVYVNDKKGCGPVSQDIYLLMYPKFFTPNGDGINDTWYIKFSQVEPEMELSIFDRYGKLITKFQSVDYWDGSLNGLPLVSDDYWFSIKRQNGKVFRGHFTLKR
jgi:gliding motility-associated-like protein